MNKYKLAQIMAIGIAIEEMQRALKEAEAKGDAYSAENLRLTIKEAGIALIFAENCIREEY